MAAAPVTTRTGSDESASGDTTTSFRFDPLDASYLTLFGGGGNATNESEWLWGSSAVGGAQQQATTSSKNSKSRQTSARRHQQGNEAVNAEQESDSLLSMGNYDRDSLWRTMPQNLTQNQQQMLPSASQYSGIRTHSTGPLPANNSSNAYFTSQLSDLERRHLVSTMPGVYGSMTPSGSNSGTGTAGGGYYNNNNNSESPSVGKRPRLSSTTSSSGGSSYGRSSPVMAPTSTPNMTGGNSSSNNSYALRPIDSSLSNNSNNSNNMYASYQPLTIQTNQQGATPGYDRENPLPDFNSDWFLSRMSPVTSSSMSSFLGNSNNVTTSSASGNNNSSGGNNSGMPMDLTGSGNTRGFAGLVGLGSPTGSSSLLGGVELIPDYESGLYSLWNGSNGASLMGYDPDPEPSQQQQQQRLGGQVSTPSSQMYLPGDEELRIEYPQLSELNQNDFDYLYGPMENGNQTPTTPLGTSASNELLKQELTNVLATEQQRRPQEQPRIENRSVMPSNHRKRKNQPAQETSNSSSNSRPPTAVNNNSSSSNSKLNSRKSGEGGLPTTGGFRSLARNANIETRRPPQQQQQQPSALMHLQSSAGAGPSMMRPTSTTGAAPLSLRQPMLPLAPPPSIRQQTSPGATAANMVMNSSAAGAGVAAGALDTGDEGSAASKKPRSRQCDHPGCLNRARSHQKCKKHGGAHQCVHEGCTKNSQSRGLCIAHGGGSRCKFEGCVRAAQSKGLCKSHGGGEFCAVEGCRKKAHLKHLCRNHGGGVRCKNPKCAKWAQRKGWCMAHAKEILGS